MNRDDQPMYRYNLWFYIEDQVCHSIAGNIIDKEEANHQARLQSIIYERTYFPVRIDLNDDDESDEFE